MSKIDDALFEIKQYLAGSDHSESDKIRQAANIYALACREISLMLKECRQLIAKGLLLDAQKLSMEMQPTLTERAQKLLLPEEQLNRYRELCILYNYPTAEVIDRKTLDQLLQAPGEQHALLNELILRWRKTARTGTNAEKIKLLRKIISNTREDDQIWRTNLASVERQWVNNLQKEAENAISEGDDERVAKIYMALTDPDLLKPVSATVLEKLQPYVRSYQQRELKNELEKKRSMLFNAYSSQNIDLAADLLREYDILITNPLYQPDIVTEQAVQEVRDYLKEQTDRRNTEKFHAEKLAELTSLLNKNGDYALIENIYHALQKTDIPLDSRLSQRVANRREEYMAESNRRHVRKCIYGVLGSAASVILAVLIFQSVSLVRTYTSYQEAMRDLLHKSNNRGVIKLHDEIKQKNPILLQFGNLTALRLEAEKALAEQKELEKKLANLLTSAETQLQAPQPNLEELQAIKKSIDKLNVKNLTAPLAERLQKIDSSVRKLEFDTQQEIDNTYLREYSKYMQKLTSCQKKLSGKNVHLENIKNEIKLIMRSMQNLTDQSPKVQEKIRNSQNKLVQEKGKALLIDLENIVARQNLQRALNSPQNFMKYSETLKTLPVKAPDLAVGKWKDAVNDIFSFQELAAAATLEICTTRTEYEKMISEEQINISDNCFSRDLLSILPDKDFSSRFAESVNKLRDELSKLYDYYEITLVAEDNSYWHFYSDSQPQLDKKRSSRIPKAFGIRVMLIPGDEGKFLPILITRGKNGKYIFTPGDFSDIALPGKFIEIKNVQLTSLSFAKSRQSIFLEDLLRRLNTSQTPEQLETELRTALTTLSQAQDMNIFARAYLFRKLLDLYALISGLHAVAIAQPASTIDSIAKNIYSSWYMPSICAENPQAVKKLNDFFKNFSLTQLNNSLNNTSKLFKHAISRRLTPGGIVLKDSQGSKLHWFDGMDHKEMWFMAPASQQKPAGWIVLDKQNNLTAKNQTLKNHGLDLKNGTVFFVPLDSRNTVQLTTEIKKAAQSQGVSILAWPESWPLNIR